MVNDELGFFPLVINHLQAFKKQVLWFQNR